MKFFLGALWKQVPLISCESEVISTGQLGIVAKKSEGDESWKAYCGVVSSDNTSADMNKEKKDIDAIVKAGAQLTEGEARAWFPDIKLKYRH